MQKEYEILDQQLAHLKHSKDLLEYLEGNGGEMKINLSVNAKEFKRQVENLRQKLNECQANGILDEGFKRTIK